MQLRESSVLQMVGLKWVKWARIITGALRRSACTSSSSVLVSSAAGGLLCVAREALTCAQCGGTWWPPWAASR